MNMVDMAMVTRQKKQKGVTNNMWFAKKNTQQDLLGDQNNILNEQSPFYMKEAYKTLRTNLTFSLPVDGCKVLVVTSSLASEGKSTNSLNLAISFAQTNAKVLLMDCDLRKPNIGRLLSKKAAIGISNVLVNLAPLEQAILPTDYANLNVICSGDIPPNPSELLESDKMEEVIRTLSQQYDYIIIDTPPVNVVTDTSILSKYASGVILVVRYGISKKEEVNDAIKQLKFTNAKLLGFVLNGDSSSTAGKNYRYKYRKSYYQYK